jgi:DNA-binding CsgD family transcriptional regulator
VEPVLAALMTLMEADVAGLYWHQLFGTSWPVSILPLEALAAIPFEHRVPQPTSVGAAMHPGWRVCLQGPTAPFRLSDVVSDLTWRSSPVATELRPYWGEHHQFAIPLYSREDPTTLWVWVLARCGQDFSERHRELAHLVRPVLARFTRSYRAAVAHPTVDPGGLTERERVVLQHLSLSHTAAHVADVLEISPRTVNKHLEHIYRKLGVDNRFHAIEKFRHMSR